MRKIIVQEFITLDGVMQAPGGPDEDTESGFKGGGWTAPYFSGTDDAAADIMAEWMRSTDILLGRKTYDQFAAYWPTQNGSNPFADSINQYAKYVVSTTLEKADWNNTNILRDVAKDVAALKDTEGGDILVYGSATLVKSLLHHNLVDELRLMMFPVIVGGGLRIFDDGRELKKFQLKLSRTIDTGVLILEYEPIK